MIDFRSDTVTQPTPAMYDALRAAPLGDDVFGDDPTVHELEQRSAERLGKEAALFVPSGTMANNIAMAVSTRPGDEIIQLEDGHTFLFEAGGSARLWGVHSRPLAGQDGCLTPEQVEGAIRPDDPHFPRTSLVVLENTHNMQGGRVVPLEKIHAISRVCREHGLKLHLDGARLFNAVVASGTSARDFAAPADTVSFCLSKGLSCPIGSLLVGSHEAIAEGRRVRKLLGGGMRQAGVIAACGLIALEQGIDRLDEDHRRARALASGLASLEGIHLQPDPPETNILMVSFGSAPPPLYRAMIAGLKDAGIHAVSILDQKLRFVTHRGIDDEAIEQTLARFRLLWREIGGVNGADTS